MAGLAIGSLLAAPILKVVVGQIGSAIGGQITRQKNFDKDLRRMKAALESVESVLEDAERRSVTDKLTRLWLKELKVAMYAISDMIEEFEIDTNAAEPSAGKFSLKKHLPGLKIIPKTILANKMKTMRKDLEKITGQHKNFNLLVGTNANELKVPDERETSSNMDDNIIFSRTEERDTILASLSESMNEEIIVLPIYGIGGLGKTTLAQMIYSSSQFKDYSHVWVYVSQIFDLKKIGNSIIAQLLDKDERKSFSPYTERQMIENSLAEIFAARKKILIVLDDLWEDKQIELDKLKDMLKLGNSSKVVVIVTTRNESIALEVCTIQPHKLAVLSPGMCWSIIKHKSDFGSRDDKKELEQIGMDIASKCGGVALAAQSLGYVLKSMMPRQWESIRDSDIWSVYASGSGDPSLTHSEDQSLNYVLASLRLSYSVMPSRLKLCFAYCAIFPKGHKIIKDDLIRQWISLAFIEPTNMFSSWELGERYIRQLLGLSFLQDSESPLAAELHLEDATLFTMHDLVRDLARSVMFDEIIIAGEHGNTGGSCCRYALLNDCSKPLEPSKIRAFRFMDCGEIELNGAAFSSAKSLRVLDLSECSIHKLPDSTGVLKQLRYLNAPRVQHSSIPDSITKLSKLIYLKLNESPAILALPESIGDIEGLMYLDLSGCSGIEKLPASLGRLKKLVHLDLSNCSRVRGVSVFFVNFTELKYLNLSHCSNIGRLPGALGCLSELQYLNLSFSSYLERCQEAEVLGTFSKIEYLNLSSEDCELQKLPEALSRCVKLKYLNLTGCRHMKKLPASFGNLSNLVHLDLTNCGEVNGVPEALDGLSKLQYLNLSRVGPCEKQSLAGLPNVIGNLTELRYFNLSGYMNYITEAAWDSYRRDRIDSFIDRISTLSNLEHLDLSHNLCFGTIPACFCKLRKLHTMDFSYCSDSLEIPKCIGTMDSLKTLYLKGCPLRDHSHLSGSSVTLPRFVVRPGDGESSSNLVLLQHRDPEELELTRLENVKSAEEAQCILLINKRSMKTLELQWTRGAQRFVYDKMLLEKLVPPSTVKKFKILGYNTVSFPAWLMNITHYLPNLVSLEMWNMPNCKVLPPASQLPNLNMLVLSGMESVEEWNTSYSSGEEYVITYLKIHACPKLRIKSFPPRAKQWNITRSDNVLSCWEKCAVSPTGASSVTTDLIVDECKVPLYNWSLLQHLAGLVNLSIRNCSDLTGSPEIIQHLSSVETLVLDANDQDELPEWLGHLTSLRKLDITRYTGLMELHENMRQLKKLQSLQVHLCNSMASLPRWLGELTSLKKLTIWGCQGIRSLPDSIQQLTNLQELSFYFCSQLKHLIESEENKTALTDMKERVCVLPTSLKELHIELCNGITSLPEGIQQLTNLHLLNISYCRELVKWCESEENKMKLTHIKEKNYNPTGYLDPDSQLDRWSQILELTERG